MENQRIRMIHLVSVLLCVTALICLGKYMVILMECGLVEEILQPITPRIGLFLIWD